MNANKHQGSTHPKEIQLQGNMDSYTGTLSVIRATVMDIFLNQYPYRQPKSINLAMIGFMMMQQGDMIKKT